MAGWEGCVDLCEDVRVTGPIAVIGYGDIIGAMKSDLGGVCGILSRVKGGVVVPTWGLLLRRHVVVILGCGSGSGKDRKEVG